VCISGFNWVCVCRYEFEKKRGGCSITLNVKLVDNEKRFQTYFVGTFFKLNYV
jgi:hypothetical protein